MTVTQEMDLSLLTEAQLNDFNRAEVVAWAANRFLSNQLEHARVVADVIDLGKGIYYHDGIWEPIEQMENEGLNFQRYVAMATVLMPARAAFPPSTQDLSIKSY